MISSVQRVEFSIDDIWNLCKYLADYVRDGRSGTRPYNILVNTSTNGGLTFDKAVIGQ